MMATGTAGASLASTLTGHAHFTFKTVSGTVVGSASCPASGTTTIDNSIPCATTGKTGAGTGSILTLKTGSTLTNSTKTLVLSNSVTFTITILGTHCDIHLGKTVTLKKQRNGSYAGGTTTKSATVTGTATVCGAVATTLRTGSFTASITL